MAYRLIVLIGKATVDTSRLVRHPNVHLLGRRPYAALPQGVKLFVGVMSGAGWLAR